MEGTYDDARGTNMPTTQTKQLEGELIYNGSRIERESRTNNRSK
jgi:hypothetical protein